MRFEVVLNDIGLEPAIFSHYLGKITQQVPALSKAQLVDRAMFDIRQRGNTLEVRVPTLRSKDFQGQGGAQWKSGQLVFLQGMVQLAPRWLENIPKEWLARFPEDGQGHKIVKGAFRNKQWTLYGRSGPLLRASWEGVS